MGRRWTTAVLLAGVVLGISACGSTAGAAPFADPRVGVLLDAAGHGDRATVERLRGEGVDVDARDSSRRTPLIRAVLDRHPLAVTTLLGAGADPALGDATGRTALHWAAQLSSPSMLQTLIEAGVDPSTPDSVTGGSALTNALMTERATNVTFLIQHGIDLDMTNRSGDTALHTAAKINQFDAVIELMAAGADPTVVNRLGVTFQRYLFMTPEKVLNASTARDRDRVEQELMRRGIPVEK